MENGEIILKKQTLTQIKNYLFKRAALLSEEHKRFISPHLYKVGISEKLMETRNILTKQLKTLK